MKQGMGLRVEPGDFVEGFVDAVIGRQAERGAGLALLGIPGGGPGGAPVPELRAEVRGRGLAPIQAFSPLRTPPRRRR